MRLRKIIISRKKAQIAQLQTLIPILVGVAIVLVIGLLILAEAKDQVVGIQRADFCGGSLSFNETVGVAKNLTCYNATAPTDFNHSGWANYTFAWNGTSTTQDAISTVPGWIPIIVIVVIGSILLGLITYFRQGR